MTQIEREMDSLDIRGLSYQLGAGDEEVMKVGFKEEVALEPGLGHADMAAGRRVGSAGSGDTQAGECKVVSGGGRCLEGVSLKQVGQKQSDEAVERWGVGRV